MQSSRSSWLPIAFAQAEAEVTARIVVGTITTSCPVLTGGDSRVVGEGSKPNHDDHPERTTADLGGVGVVVRLPRVGGDLAEVGNLSSLQQLTAAQPADSGPATLGGRCSGCFAACAPNWM